MVLISTQEVLPFSSDSCPIPPGRGRVSERPCAALLPAGLKPRQLTKIQSLHLYSQYRLKQQTSGIEDKVVFISCKHKDIPKPTILECLAEIRTRDWIWTQTYAKIKHWRICKHQSYNWWQISNTGIDAWPIQLTVSAFLMISHSQRELLWRDVSRSLSLIT